MNNLEKLLSEVEIAQGITQTFYEMWVESGDYNEESAIENRVYDENNNEIQKCIGEQLYHAISDNIMSLSCEAERAGFESGLRYGIMFMNGILKGGAK